MKDARVLWPILYITLSLVAYEAVMFRGEHRWSPAAAHHAGSPSAPQRAEPPGKLALQTEFFDAHVAQMALHSTGDDTRMRVAVDRAERGLPLKIVVVGGSISAGNGGRMSPGIETDVPGYVEQSGEVLRRAFPAWNVTVVNRAFGATSAGFTGSCVDRIVDKDADVVLVEYAANEAQTPPGCKPQDQAEGRGCYASPSRRAFERLLRRLLELPHRPAVAMVHAYVVRSEFWEAAPQQEFSFFAEYYGLPQLSMRAFHHLVLQGRPGFRGDLRRINLNGDPLGATLDKELFFYDNVHPYGPTGHRYMAEVVGLFFKQSAAAAAVQAVTPDDTAYVAAPLPPPVLPGNYAPNSSACWIGGEFMDVVGGGSGFKWVNDRPGAGAPLAKWGWAATDPGAQTELRFSSVTDGGATALVNLGHLKSYEGLGRARVACASGCACKPLVLNGYQKRHASTTEILAFEVTQREDCALTVTVLEPETPGAPARVKLLSLVVLPVGTFHGAEGSPLDDFLEERAEAGAEGEAGATAGAKAKLAP